MFLRGRPIILNATSDVKEIYDVTKVQPAPNKKLKLDWVYGYRGKDCRSNLYQLPTGEMAYFVASVIVLYNVDEQSQRHYIGTYRIHYSHLAHFVSALNFDSILSMKNLMNYSLRFSFLIGHTDDVKRWAKLLDKNG